MRRAFPALMCFVIVFSAFSSAAQQQFKLNTNEAYEYNLQYVGINAGTAVIEIGGIEDYDGKKVYHIKSSAKSSAWISVLYKVDDKVDSYIDVAGFFSRKLVKSIREGRFSQDITIYFDQENKKVRDGDKTCDIPYGTQDILSAFFYFKVQKLEAGKDWFIDVYADGKVHKLQVQTLGRERIKTPAGEFKTLKVKPIMKFETIFKQDGDVAIWLTDDDRHIPVLMKSKVVIGSVSAVLVKVRKSKSGDGK